MRVMALFEPTLAPAPVICEEPLEAVEPAMTMAPMGLPGRKVPLAAATSAGTLPRKKKLAREKPTRCGVEQARAEDVLLLDAGDLLAEGLVDERERVLGGGVCGRIVGGVDGEEEVVGGEVGVEAGGAEVLADVLRRVGVGEGDAGGQALGVEELGAVLHGPEVEERGGRGADGCGRGDAGGVGKEAGAGVIVGDEGDVGDAEVLYVTFVVTEEEELVTLDGAAEGAAVVVALEVWDAGLVEVVCGRRRRELRRNS